MRADVGRVDLAELLRALHDTAVHWTESQDPVLLAWGRHLLEDWRSLELLAEAQRETPEL